VAPKCSAEVTLHHSLFIALANGVGAVRADTSKALRNGARNFVDSSVYHARSSAL
jgi:hypothetical protein